jgi:hypothetical protein
MYSDQENLTPQLDEGITELGWKSHGDMEAVFENTYPNIELLLAGQI